MKEKIISILHNLEKQYDIKILLAVNQGSRCFGYASQQSDWDIRFIYIHRPQWYFSIVKTDDFIKLMIEDENLDIDGFDLKKVLYLLSKTNPTVSDWFHASEYYIIDQHFLQQMHLFESQCYNPHHALRHFYSVGAKHNQRYLTKKTTLKRFLYYMRGLLSCRWVEQYGTHPPVNLDELINATITDSLPINLKAHALLDAKRMGKTNDTLPVDADLYRYIANLHKYYEHILPHSATPQSIDIIESMSEYLMTVVLQKWNSHTVHTLNDTPVE